MDSYRHINKTDIIFPRFVLVSSNSYNYVDYLNLFVVVTTTTTTTTTTKNVL